MESRPFTWNEDINATILVTVKSGIPSATTYEKCPADYMNHTSIDTAIIVYGVANLDHLLSREGLFAPDEPKNYEKKK
jgi:hypothetical protein